jgi:hypothetical protein
MRLANDIIAIPLGSHAVRLRPSLRAAIRLHAQHDLRKLAAGIIEGHFGMVADLIMEGTDHETAHHLVRAISAKGAKFLPELVEPLLAFILALLGSDHSTANETSTDKADTTADQPDWIAPYLEDLFGIGTGWLGWSPAETMAATPNEIIVANRAHLAKLKAIHGAADKPANDPREEVSPDEVKAGIAKLKQIARQGKHK